MRTRSHLALLTLSTVLAASGCADEYDNQETVGSQQQAWIAPPPHPVASPGQYAWASANLSAVLIDYGRTSARVYYPINGKKRPPRNTPLVVVLNGNGFSHTDYDYLGRHLATYGMVVLSVEADAALPVINGPLGLHCVADRAERAHQFIDWFRTNWSYANHVDYATLGVVGHSQGGEAAMVLAQRITADATLGNPSPRAVVALAPSDLDEVALGGDDARSLLVLYGTNDEDVAAPISPNASTVVPHLGPFAIYDRAGTEESVGLGSPTSDRLRKHMKLIYGANHRQFSDHCGFAICNGDPSWADEISCDAQHDITKGAANAFLRWHLLGESDYQTYFNGQFDETTTLGGYVWYSSDPWEWVDIFPQHSDGLGTRLVIDNFQDGSLNTPNLGGTVLVGPGVQAEVIDNQQMLARSPHGPVGGERLRVWNSDGTYNAWVGWLLADGGTALNATSYDYLRFRVGRVLGGSNARTPMDNPGFAVGVQIVANGQSSAVLSTWNNSSSPQDGRGYLPEPHLVDGNIFPICGLLPTQEQTMAHMRSFRIPLADFNVDLSAITDIYLYFDAAEMPGEELYLDNLEIVTESGMP